MLCAVSLFLLATPSDVRGDFYRAINKVREGWTKAQVQKVLGKPDDVWPPNDDRRFVMAGDETWCYGTNGHHTLPTLGRVTFRDGKVLYMPGADQPPPSPKLISEAELRTHMRSIHRLADPFEHGDPLRLIQAANDLRPLGKEKALAVLNEYGRVAISRNQDWMFWLARVLFTSSRPGGVFRVPGLGGMHPKPPKDPTSWPRYPILLIDDVPVSLYRGAHLAGVPEPFEWYVRDERKFWSMTTRKLRPPDDPFPIYQKVVAAKQWPFPRADPQRSRFRGPYLEDEGYVLLEILRLVRTAYRPARMEAKLTPSINGLDYDKYHAEFLKLGCRWDEARQMYVRGDGSFTPDVIQFYPQHVYRFKGLPKLDVSVTFSRSSDGADYSAEVSERGPGKIGNAILVVEDPDTGNELYWTALNDPKHQASWESTKEKILNAVPHAAQPGTVSVSSGFRLGSTRRLMFKVLTAEKTYSSPAFKL